MPKNTSFLFLFDDLNKNFLKKNYLLLIIPLIGSLAVSPAVGTFAGEEEVTYKAGSPSQRRASQDASDDRIEQSSSINTSSHSHYLPLTSREALSLEEEAEDTLSLTSASSTTQKISTSEEGNTQELFGVSGPSNPIILFSELPNKESLDQLSDPYLVSFAVQAKEGEQPEAKKGIISLLPLKQLKKEYKIPKRELKKLSPMGKFTQHLPDWKACVEGAKEIKNIYSIRPSARAFTAIEVEGEGEHDYYDISLDFTLNTPENLKSYHFLPKSFFIQVQPVRHNLGRWKVVSASECPLDMWEYFPEAIVGQAEATSTKGHTYTATAIGGISGNLLTGGPSASASLTAAASYTSTFSFKRNIPDMDIKPFIDANEVRWEITFNNLMTDSTKGFCSDGTRRINPLRWIWKVNREKATRELYSPCFLGHHDTFYFKINVFARFAHIGEKGEKKKTEYLPIFDNENGEISQIFGLFAPDTQQKYKIVKEMPVLGNEIRT